MRQREKKGMMVSNDPVPPGSPLTAASHTSLTPDTSFGISWFHRSGNPSSTLLFTYLALNLDSIAVQAWQLYAPPLFLLLASMLAHTHSVFK